MVLRLLQLLLLGILTLVFMKEGIRFCHECNSFDGFQCRVPMKHCWKFNIFSKNNRSCTTEHYYYYHRVTGRYFYHYTRLSCKVCEEGMVQVFHDLLKETHCCTDKPLCNTGHDIAEKSVLYGEDKYTSIHDDIPEN
uniref:Prostate and testis expressed 2 n=2 Tax=Canis lupus TaxID=9612 RepID=A0A8C0SYI1_CANLF